MITKKFSDFTVEFLEEMFDLVPVETNPYLQQWLTIASTPNEVELNVLVKLRQKLLNGAYIVERNWFFVVLAESEYAVSLAYDVTQADINDIFVILKNFKIIIEKTSGVIRV